MYRRESGRGIRKEGVRGKGGRREREREGVWEVV